MAEAHSVIVIGGGHAGVEAAWAAASVLGDSARVALVTMDPSKIGAMSCNPAIGGLAKGQMVREIDALGGVMGLAADATGIQFRMLNMSKGAAVRGPRAQCDRHAYAREVRRLLSTRSSIEIVAGTVERIVVERGAARGVVVGTAAGEITLSAPALVLTTGTFMRAMMHTGDRRTPGGRVEEGSAAGISAALRSLGFELGRLKTGTPPRLSRASIDWRSLPSQPGDAEPTPFSDLTPEALPLARFPAMSQVECRETRTSVEIHDLIRENLHLAPMYGGRIEAECGPRYCPSIEDKVVRFGDRDAHHVFLEPESLETSDVYCNGISTSLPEAVQDRMVRAMPGCGRAEIVRYGYAVEYDMVWPHQIDATGETKLVESLFLAGQINGTSGYEEAAAQGVVAGLNAARRARRLDAVRFGRDEAYIGVLMDDLVTRTPREPYRMFTSRAEHRLRLRADNADERLTARGRELGLVCDRRWSAFERRREALDEIRAAIGRSRADGVPMIDWIRRSDPTATEVSERLDLRSRVRVDAAAARRLVDRVVSDVRYEGYLKRQEVEVRRQRDSERTPIPVDLDPSKIPGLRREAVEVLTRFRPATMGQASRLSGVNPADVTLIAVAIARARRTARERPGLQAPGDASSVSAHDRPEARRADSMVE